MKPASPHTLLLLAIYLTIPTTATLTYLDRTPIPQLPITLPTHNFNGTIAYQLLTNLTRDYSGRVIGSRNDSLTASWIASWFKGLGLNTTLQSFPTVDFQGNKVNGTNVYAISPGRTNQTLILLAHHDVVPRTQQGADDNGSGTVILMELARTLTRTPHNLTYYFLSTDSEEINLGGSSYFAKHTANHLNVALALSIDEVGYKDAKSLLIYAYSHQTNYTDAGTMLTAVRIGERLNLPTAPQLPDQIEHRINIRFFTSDSENFLTQGIQSYALADDNPMYPYTHTPQDTLDQVSATRLDNVGYWVQTLGYNLDQGLVMPTLGQTYLIYSDGFTPQTLILLNISPYALAALAAPIWLLQREKPRVKAFVTDGKPILATFLILLAAALLPITLPIVGLWPPISSTSRNLLATLYAAEALVVVAFLALFSGRIFQELKITSGAVAPEKRDQWVTVLLSGTFLLNLFASPFSALIFLALPTLLPPLTFIKHHGGSLRLFLALFTPFPLYAIALASVLIFSPQGAVSFLIDLIISGGTILLQLGSVVAILVSLGYSIGESLE
jgi:peptidase M28-like protein